MWQRISHDSSVLENTSMTMLMNSVKTAPYVVPEKRDRHSHYPRYLKRDSIWSDEIQTNFWNYRTSWSQHPRNTFLFDLFIHPDISRWLLNSLHNIDVFFGICRTYFSIYYLQFDLQLQLNYIVFVTDKISYKLCPW